MSDSYLDDYFIDILDVDTSDELMMWNESDDDDQAYLAQQEESLAESDDDWRDSYEVEKDKTGLDPEDFDDEDEYLDALNEVDESDVSDDTDEPDDTDETGLDPEDFDDEAGYIQAYRAALVEAAESDEKDEPDKAVQVNREIVVGGVREKTKPKRKAEGIYKYKNEYGFWDFTEALFDNFPELNDDYTRSTKPSVPKIINDVLEYDIPRALRYWKWLLETFPAKTFANDKNYDGMPYDKITLDVLGAISCDDAEAINNFLKDRDVYNYFIKSIEWNDGDYLSLASFVECGLCCYDFDFVIMAYKDYFHYQNKLKRKEICDLLYNIINDCPKVVSEEFYYFLETEIAKLGPIADSVKKEFKKTIKYDGFDANNVMDWYIGDSRNISEQVEKQIVELEISADSYMRFIDKGVLYDKSYENDKRQFKYCFINDSSKASIVAGYLLSKNGELEKEGENRLVGNISSDDIETLYMLLDKSYTLPNYCKYKYKTAYYKPDEENAFKINLPIIEYLEKYCYPVKLQLLIAYARSLGVDYFNTSTLYKAYHTFRDCEVAMGKKLSAAVNELSAKGKVKAGWVNEKRLFSYASLNYPDAEYKYSPDWANGLAYDIYFPSLKLAVEFEPFSVEAAAEFEKASLIKANERYREKKNLAISNGLTFETWENSRPISEESFISFMKELLPKIKSANICPRCGGKLIERAGKYGKFLGCENYPDCKFTQKRK